ncbi:MAG: NAD(P)H-binding protein [Deltaproteobacteria bacterium]|nr:NAD(P)H-binding protein [Deltaproteobacteria bacterium]
MRRVLVLGAGGFVGRHLLDALRQRGLEPRALVRDPARAQAALGARAEGLALVAGDVTDRASVLRACEGCDALVHLVAVEFEKGAMTFERVHVEGTEHTVSAAAEAGLRRVVYLGQISPGGAMPSLRFTYTKWLGEERVRASGLDYTVLRAGLVLGPGDHFLREVTKLSRLPVVPLAGGGGTLFQPLGVWDLAEALARCVSDTGTVGETLDLAGPERVTYRALTARALVALGRPRPLVALPSAALWGPAWLAQAVLPRPPLTPDLLRLLAIDNVTDQSALGALLGREPAGVDEVLRRALGG